MSRDRHDETHPSGWYSVASTRELKPGGVLPLRYFGRELVAFRGKDHRARVLDAHCPHLGAHLGQGGEVVGNRLRCPFHHWCFDGAGRCVEIPYADRVPPRAGTRAWPVDEHSGMILVYHGDGEANEWRVPAIEELGARGFRESPRLDWRVRARAQDVVEQIVDTAHFTAVHGFGVTDFDAEFDGPHLYTRGRPAADITQQRSFMRAIHNRLPAAPSLRQSAHGLGVIVTRFRMPRFFEFVIVETATPVEQDLLDLRFTFSIRCSLPWPVSAIVARLIRRDFVSQVESDRMIWENKVYRASPMLVRGDGPIHRFRRWAEQFEPRSRTRAVRTASLMT